MADKRNKRLTREGEASQKTDKGLEIPIPKADEFFGLLKRAARKTTPGQKARSPEPEKPSQSERE
jgi:hypothetical protein